MNERIQSQMRKWILEYIILWIINKKDIYGTEIIEILKENNLIIIEWTLYPILTRLKKDWFIDYYKKESENWYTRKYYNLTRKWNDMLIIMEKNWLDLKNVVSGILGK